MQDYHSYIAIFTQPSVSSNIWKDYILPLLPSFLAIFSGAIISHISSRYALKNSLITEKIKETSKSLGLLKLILNKIEMSMAHSPLVHTSSKYPYTDSDTPKIKFQHAQANEFLKEISNIIEGSPSLLSSASLDCTLKLIARTSFIVNDNTKGFSMSNNFIDNVEIPDLYKKSIDEIKYAIESLKS